MRVAAVLVIGDDDLWPELAQDPYQRFGRFLDRNQREQPSGSGGGGSPSGSPES